MKMTVYKFDRLCFVRRSSGSAATIVALRVGLMALPIFLTRLGSNNSTKLRPASVEFMFGDLSGFIPSRPRFGIFFMARFV